MSHSGAHSHHTGDMDWTAMADHLELEAEVLLPYVTETARLAADLCRRDGLEVRRILDVGSGPGVIACELARRFPSAAVVAADGAAPLLERAAARAKTLALSDRVTTRRVDLPDDIESLGRADLIWMAMVLHHIGDEGAMLRRLRGMLAPGGVLIVAEHGEPLRFLPDGADQCPPGLAARIGAADSQWLAGLRAGLPDSVPSAGYREMLEAAGFEVLVDRVVHVQIDAPLSMKARKLLLGRLQRMREIFGEQLEAHDIAALDGLIDENSPLGIMQRPDALVDASRHVYIART